MGDDPRIIDPLIQALKNNPDEGGDLSDIADTLVDIGAPAVDPLIQLLKDKNLESSRRSRVVEALGEIKDPRAVEPLIENLKDDYACDESAVALKRIGGRTVDQLILALKSENPLMRERAAYALGYIEDQRAINPLKELLKDENEDVRNSAERALGILGG